MHATREEVLHEVGQAVEYGSPRAESYEEVHPSSFTL